MYRQEIDEKNKILELWVRRKRGNRKLECSGCGRKFADAYDSNERSVRDLPWSELRTTVHIEVYRVKCPVCGVKIEKVPLLPSKAPFSKRFEDAVGLACESASARQVGRRMGLAGSTVRAIDLRYLERWDAKRRNPPLRHMGVDELYRGKKGKFLTVVCNLETGEPLWFGKERKKETLDEFFRSELVSRQRKRIEAVCVDMWEPFRLSIEQWAPQCKIVYDKFHVLQHANDAINEVRRAEFFRQGPKKRGLIKGKKWLLQESMEESDVRRPRGTESAVSVEPAGLQSLPAKREPGEIVDLPVSRGHAQLPAEVDGSTEVAATEAVRETGRDVAEARGRDCELLRNQGSLRGCGSPQWKHSHADQPRTGLSEPSLSTAEGQAAGGEQHRIHRTHQRAESSVKWPSLTDSCSEPFIGTLSIQIVQSMTPPLTQFEPER